MNEVRLYGLEHNGANQNFGTHPLQLIEKR